MLAVGDVADNLLPRALIGPQVLLAPLRVALDDGVRRTEDVLRRAVVLLEQDRRGVRVVLLELDDVADRRAAERIDRLVGVTDDAQVGHRHALSRARVALGIDGFDAARRLLTPGEFTHEHVLRVVRVLVLVDEDVAEAAPVVLGHLRERLQDRHRRHDDVVEVERVRGREALLVKPVGVGDLAFLIGLGATRGLLGVDELVLEVAHLEAEGLGRVTLRVEVEIAGDHRHEALAVGGVVDGERRLEAHVLGLAAQDAHARRVERAHPHRVRGAPDELLDAFTHLGRSLVREGDGEDLPGLGSSFGHEVGDAVGEHPRLARTGTGHDEQRRTEVLDGLRLLRVHALEQARGVRAEIGPG